MKFARLSVFVFLSSALVAGGVPVTAAAAPISIPKEQRTPNRSDAGVCWFACVETAGRYVGIRDVEGLVEAVLSTGIGLHGATAEAIRYWSEQRRLSFRQNPHGHTAEGLAWIQRQLAEGLPVIVSIRLPSGGSHAILVTDVTEQKTLFNNGQGYQAEDRVVTYLDPNDVAYTFRHTLTWFWSVWTGDAWSLPPPRLLRDMAPVSAVSVGVVTTTLPKPPASNQDIKDGVQRPLDRIDLEGFQDRKHRATKPVPP